MASKAKPKSAVTPGNRLPHRAGISLKADHYRDIIEQQPVLGWFEVHPENYMGAGGPPHAYLGRIRELYPLSLHGVGLSLGGAERPDPAHLARLRALIDRYQPQSFSEHLAWSTHQGRYFNDLLALPYTQATAALVCDHIDEVQEHLGRRLLLENPSTYVTFADSEIDEIDFLKTVAARTGCGLLLDVNNVYVSCCNRREDPTAYIDLFPHNLVGEIHLAGHAVEADAGGGRLLIDTHDRAIADEVWALFERTLAIAGPRPTLIERDGNIPPLNVLMAEAETAERRLQRPGSTSPEDVQVVQHELA